MDTTRPLGCTGVDVGTLGFGAWAIGGRGYGDVPVAQAEAAIETYLDAGGIFIDTARNYGNSEEILGRVLEQRGDRERVFIACKTGMTTSVEELPQIREEAETSLRLLRTDVIDLYFIHSPPDDPDLMNRVIDEFQILKDEGKVRTIGASIKGADVTPDTVALCRQYVDTGRIDAIQLIYSMLRQLNLESIDYAAKHGVGIVGRTALENGFLTGKFTQGVRFGENDHRRRWNAGIDDLLDRIAGLGEWAVRTPYQTLSQVALRFALAPSGVSTIIPGGKSATQVEANMSIADLPDLDADILKRIQTELAGVAPHANTSGEGVSPHIVPT